MCSFVRSYICTLFYFFMPFLLLIAALLPSFLLAHDHSNFTHHIDTDCSCNDHTFSAHVSLFEFIYFESVMSTAFCTIPRQTACKCHAGAIHMHFLEISMLVLC